jgi:hypothetical protein
MAFNLLPRKNLYTLGDGAGALVSQREGALDATPLGVRTVRTGTAHAARFI